VNGAIVTVLAVAGIGLLAAGSLARWPGTIGWGLGLVAAAYAVALPGIHGGARPASAAILGAAVLVAGESCFWVVTEDVPSAADARRRALWLAGWAAAAFAVAVLVMLAATVQLNRSLPLTIAGTVAAVLTVALLGAFATTRPEAGDGQETP